MKKRSLVDVGLLGVSAFTATSLLAAAGMTITRGEPRASAAPAARASASAPLSWDEAQAVLEPVVPAGAREAMAEAVHGHAGDEDHGHADAEAALLAATGAEHSHDVAPGDGEMAAVPSCTAAADHGEGHHAASAGEEGDHHGAACAADDGTVAAGVPGRTERRRTNVFADPSGSSPWEVNYEAPAYEEEGCGEATAELGVEVDPTKQCTMTHGPSFREGAPEEYFAAHGEHGHDCRVPRSEYDGAFDLAQRTRDTIGATYDNQPWVALQNGYVPFPVPGTKTFHMFNTEYYADRNADRSHVLFDPTKPEMFTYGMTDEGLMVVNVVFVYAADDQELPEERKAEWFSMLPRPFGCMLEWHAHSQGAEGPATGNVDGRDWMTHVWTYPRTGHTWEYGDGKRYEGVYPFGEYGDGSEPHAWFTPLSFVPALCNKDGGCI